MVDRIKITVLVENITKNKNLEAEHGKESYTELPVFVTLINGEIKIIR